MNTLVAAPRPRELLLRGAHVLDPRRGSTDPMTCSSRTGRSPRSARPASSRLRRGAETDRGGGQAPIPGLRRPARPPSHPGAGTQGGSRDGHARRRGRRLLRRCGDAQHGSRPRRAGAAARPARCSRRARRPRPGRLHGGDQRRPAGEQLTEMSELREAGAIGFTDDGRPVVSAGLLRRALRYQRLCGGVIALHEEDPALSGAGVDARGRRSRSRSASRGSRRSRSRR